MKKGLKIGENCYISPRVNIDPSHPELITIGDDCILTMNVTICAHDASMSRHLGYGRTGAVKIGNKCFIGVGAIILCGNHIGNNVIVGAGSVVTHDIPDNCVVAGNPAKIIGNTKDSITRYKRAN